MNHIDLFSGIGGFSLSAKQVWQEEYNNICFCEIDQFCQKVLKKNFGEDILIYDDIRTLSKERLIADTESANSSKQTGKIDPNGETVERRESKIRVKPGGYITVDLLTGGFPCQPFSAAGQRRGKEDDRYLWPEMLRVIKELKPTWIIGENVAGIINMAQQQGESDMEGEDNIEECGNEDGSAGGIIWEIINDLEQAGYSVQPFVIPACAVNAPHRRDRVWIVANTGCEHGKGPENGRKPEGQIPCQEDASLLERPISHDEQGIITHTIGTGAGRESGTPCNEGRRTSESWRKGIRQGNGQACTGGTCSADSHAPDTEKPECEPSGRTWAGRERLTDNTCFVADPTECCFRPKGRIQTQPFNSINTGISMWDEPWLEVATELCRMDDGVSSELYKLETSDRVARLKALGNAIVPQVVMPIMKAIKLINRPESD